MKMRLLKKIWMFFFALSLLTIVDITNRVNSSFKNFILFSSFVPNLSLTFKTCFHFCIHYLVLKFCYYDKNSTFEIFAFYFCFCIWVRNELKLKVTISYFITCFSFLLSHIKNVIQLIMSNSLNYFRQFIIFLSIFNIQNKFIFCLQCCIWILHIFRMHML
jgi:hypothetical protein